MVEWKDIVGYEGLYEVSTEGQIRNKRTKYILKPYTNGRYRQVSLYKDGVKKRFLVHRLVLMTFCPVENMDELTVNHRNEIKTDNRLQNLEWLCNLDNIRYGTGIARRIIAQSKPVLQLSLAGDVIKEWQSAHEVERQLGFDHTAINKCCRGVRKTHKGYKWKFKEEI